MAGLSDTEQIYIPSVQESQTMLAEVEDWIKRLKALNVSSEIAVYMARDFLSPMRILATENLGTAAAKGGLPPSDSITAVGGYSLLLEEE